MVEAAPQIGAIGRPTGRPRKWPISATQEVPEPTESAAAEKQDEAAKEANDPAEAAKESNDRAKVAKAAKDRAKVAKEANDRAEAAKEANDRAEATKEANDRAEATKEANDRAARGSGHGQATRLRAPLPSAGMTVAAVAATTVATARTTGPATANPDWRPCLGRGRRPGIPVKP